MTEQQQVDTLFTMPAVDHPALTEIGVVLVGLEARWLLAGLGAAGDRDDPTAVALQVDRLRHGEHAALSEAVSAGARRWHLARPALVAADRNPTWSASIRQAWQRALRTVYAAGFGSHNEIGPAGHAYLAACWLRCAEVDEIVAEQRIAPGRTCARG